MADKTGEAAAVVDRADLGPISLVYGNRKMGLLHIQRKHPEVFPLIPQLLREGRLVADHEGRPRAYLLDGSTPPTVAAIRLEWDGQDKTWLVTAFADERGDFDARQARLSDEQPASASSRIPDATGPDENTPSGSAVQVPDIRLADDALFGAGSASPEVDAANRAALADFRARLDAEGDFELATGRMTDGPDGPIPEIVSARQLLDEIEDEEDLAQVIGACALGGRPQSGGAGDA